MKNTLTFLAAVFAPLIVGAGAPAVLKTEFLEDPLGIDTEKPRFSWIVEDPAEGARQTAYQLQVSSSEDKLTKGEADFWDSGKIVSDQSHLVEYAGKPLASRRQVWWRVKSWDKAGKESGWSRPARFELALLEKGDWTAEWITTDINPDNGEGAQLWVKMAAVPVVAENITPRPAGNNADSLKQEMVAVEGRSLDVLKSLKPAPVMRREIALNGKVLRARAYVAAPGFFELQINGKRVGDRELEPGIMPFREQTLYVVHDITPYVQPGTNAFGLILGQGWFVNPHIGHCNGPAKTPAVLAQFEFEFEDGHREIFGTDGSWRAASGPILKDAHWLGECYDARQELPGWSRPGFNDSAWETAQVIPSPAKQLMPDLTPPERVIRRVSARRLYSPADGVWVYDMGEAFSGAAELKVNVPAGTALILRYSQRVFGPDQRVGSVLRYPDGGVGAQRDGMIAPSFGSTGASPVGVAGGKSQSYTPADVYTARGGGEEIWRRRFGYTAFRYVELTGYPGVPPKDAVTGIVIHTDLPQDGTFTSSSDPLNRIYNACVNSVLYCTHGFTQDNPAREKQFVAGFSANSAALTSSFAPDSISYMWKKMIDASVLTQDGSGHLVPFFGFRENYEDPVTESGSIPLAYQCWKRYGDDRPLRKNLDAFSAYFDYYFRNPQNRRDPGLNPRCETAAPDLSKGFIRGGMYAFDWYDDDTVIDLPPGQLPPRGARKLMWGTGVLLEDLEMFLEMARHASRDDLVEKYGELTGRIRDELNRKFYNPATGSYGCQGNDALALAAGVPAPEQRAAVVDALVRDIEKRGGRFTTGTHGFPRLLDQLAENGHGKTAFDLINREGYPGLLNQLNAGYGTLLETWNTFRSPHGEIGGVLQSERALMGGWFAERLGGIRSDPARPGFQQVILGPVFPPRLEFVRTEVPSPYGKIVSAWRRDGGTIRWNVTLPWNSGATVKLSGCRKVTVNGQPQPAGGFYLSSGSWEVVYEE